MSYMYADLKVGNNVLSEKTVQTTIRASETHKNTVKIMCRK